MGTPVQPGDTVHVLAHVDVTQCRAHAICDHAAGAQTTLRTLLRCVPGGYYIQHYRIPPLVLSLEGLPITAGTGASGQRHLCRHDIIDHMASTVVRSCMHLGGPICKRRFNTLVRQPGVLL